MTEIYHLTNGVTNALRLVKGYYHKVLFVKDLRAVSSLPEMPSNQGPKMPDGQTIDLCHFWDTKKCQRSIIRRMELRITTFAAWNLLTGELEAL